LSPLWLLVWFQPRRATPLSLQDKLSAWPDASDAERVELSRVLALVASQGLSNSTKTFLKLHRFSVQAINAAKEIGEIGAMCVTIYFNISEQNLRPSRTCVHVGAAALHSRSRHNMKLAAANRVQAAAKIG
jgi:hypothetical protein